MFAQLCQTQSHCKVKLHLYRKASKVFIMFIVTYSCDNEMHCMKTKFTKQNSLEHCDCEF